MNERIAVYNFEAYDAARRRFEVARWKATAEAIRRLDGRLLEGTAEEVDADDVDASGVYRRLATGWGELS